MPTADDEPQRPPSPSLVRGGDEDDALQTLLEAKSKLFFNLDGAWSERGVSMLQVKKPREGGGAARLLMRSETGKLWLNANVYRRAALRAACAHLIPSPQRPEGCAEDKKHHPHARERAGGGRATGAHDDVRPSAHTCHALR